ncbi:nucleoside triphosphate pyrophosphohydrolase family protein [Actinomadura soli]|nr:nucleoside triphosphate pyrophosphohydrolase family protein [Actinomadura soli]
MFDEALALVRDFHAAKQLLISDCPAVPESKREVERLAGDIEQEAAEVAEAIRLGDIEKSAREICDLLYITFGAAISLGLPLDRLFARVHESNMTKESVAPVEGVSQKPHKGRRFREPVLADILAPSQRP